MLFRSGVTEATDTEGNQFSEDRLLSMLPSDNRNSDKLLSDIVHSLQEFTTGMTQFDDTTLLAVKYTGDS